MTNRLEGKVALITGAARGQGAAEARLFAAEGASVVITDVRDDALVSLEKELLDSGATVSATRLDVADEADWDRAVQHATAVFGELNVLVNNAGILDMAGVEQTSLEVWNRIVAVNQTGVWLGMKSAIPSMRRAGGGSIVNVSSIYGLSRQWCGRGLPGDQGCGAPAHQDRGDSVRTRGHSGELASSRRDRHGNGG